MWAAHYLRFDSPRHWLTSGGAGTMAPACRRRSARRSHIRQRGVRHRRRVDTDEHPGAVDRVQHGTPVKVVLSNDCYMGMVRQWQQLNHGKRLSH